MEPVSVLLFCLCVKICSPHTKALLVTARNIDVNVKSSLSEFCSFLHIYSKKPRPKLANLNFLDNYLSIYILTRLSFGVKFTKETNNS